MLNVAIKYYKLQQPKANMKNAAEAKADGTGRMTRSH